MIRYIQEKLLVKTPTTALPVIQDLSVKSFHLCNPRLNEFIRAGVIPICEILKIL